MKISKLLMGPSRQKSLSGLLELVILHLIQIERILVELVSLVSPKPVGLTLGPPTITQKETTPMDFSLTLTDNEIADYPFVEVDKQGFPIAGLPSGGTFTAVADDPTVAELSIVNNGLHVNTLKPGQTGITLGATFADGSTLAGKGGLTVVNSAPKGLSVGTGVVTEKA